LFTSPILIASGNKDKIKELKLIAKPFGLNLLSPQEAIDLYQLSAEPEVEETGKTFQANAELKARAYSQWSGISAIADDSGLEVEALDGRPGLYSARYGGEGLNSRQRMEKLLGEMEGRENRTAYFCCSLAFVYSDDLGKPQTIFSNSKMEGEILKGFQGEGGFGYDPIMKIKSLGKTLAEVDFETTCDVGFRALAAKELFGKIQVL
jgi:XTP/dITP diphosphohydrolase